MKKQLQEHASSVVSRLEPSEKDDLISRKALMQRLHDAGGCGAPPESWADGYDKAIDLAYGMAENAPTIDPVHAAAEALGMSPDRLRELAQAEKEGRLVVLPCLHGKKLLRDGLEFEPDHWNITLTAFAHNQPTRSGKRVGLFSICEAAEAAQCGGDCGDRVDKN